MPARSTPTSLPKLAHLPLAVPVQLAMGQPAEGYPFTWTIYRWLPGENANGTIDDLHAAAVDLAEFVKALRRDGEELWVHGDLLPGNLLVVGGRLSAVIDFGCLNVGDPACDLQPAWNVFTGDSRTRYRNELQVDDASWLRGRGWALCQAVVALPYYWDTNPGMIRQASHALAQVLAENCR